MLVRLLLCTLLLTAPAAAQKASSRLDAAEAPVAPAQPQPVRTDAVRLAAARNLAATLFPPGTLRRVMQSAMDQALSGTMNAMYDLPVKSLLSGAGLAPDAAAKLPPTTMRQLMEIADPAFEQRLKLMTPILINGITDIMVAEEPGFREGYAEALARRFDVGQLREIAAFHATPTGRAYASAMFDIQTDPAYVARTQQMMPRLMQAMPAIMARVQQATAALPKPRRPTDMTAADRARIRTLLGLPDEPAQKGPTT